MDLSYTRAMVAAVLDGTVEQPDFAVDPIFGLNCPTSIKGVPGHLLQPCEAWPDKAAYEQTAIELARRFAEHFKKFVGIESSIAEAGPKLHP
jgi:phosphoenolpyruvate carboxykinase (ATP)